MKIALSECRLCRDVIVQYGGKEGATMLKSQVSHHGTGRFSDQPLRPVVTVASKGMERIKQEEE